MKTSWHVATAAEAIAAAHHGAVDAWLERHKSHTVLCLVQFKDVSNDAMPRIYLAWPRRTA